MDNKELAQKIAEKLTSCTESEIAKVIRGESATPVAEIIESVLNEHNKHRVLITVEGGVVQSCDTDGPIECYLRDWDNIADGGAREAQPLNQQFATSHKMNYFLSVEGADD